MHGPFVFGRVGLFLCRVSAHHRKGRKKLNTYAFDLDLDKRFSDQVVIIGQSDHNGTALTATLYKDGTRFTTSNLTAYFAMKLPGGGNYYRKEGTYNGGVITVTLDEEYAGAVAGKTDVAYFEIHQGSTVIASTARFLVVVLESATHGMTEGYRYDDEVIAAVHEWLDAHPEKVTTVQPNGIDTEKLAPLSVTNAKLAQDAVTNFNMADDSVNTAEIVNGAVTTDKLGGSSVTTAKIDNLAVTEAKLAADSVTRSKIADDAVGTDEIANASVTTPKIANGSITGDKLAQGLFHVVTDAEIAAMIG